MERSAFIPGKFLKYLYILIEKAIKNKWETIDRAKVAMILDEGTDHFSLDRPVANLNVDELTPTKIQL